MSDISEYVAAAIIEVASANRQGISSEVEEIYYLPAQKYDWQVSKDQIDRALITLQRLGVAELSDNEFAGSFIAIGRRAFVEFYERAEMEAREYERIVLEASDENLGISRAESRRFPRLEALNNHRILRDYARFGKPWLRAAIEKLRSVPNNDDLVASEIVAIDSRSWTGLYTVSDADRDKIASYILEIKQKIDSSNLSNSQKAEALAIISAAEKLAESPNPWWEMIVKLLSSPILANITSVAALATAIITGN